MRRTSYTLYPRTYIISGIYQDNLQDNLLTFACKGYNLKQALREYLDHNLIPREELDKIYGDNTYDHYQLNIIHLSASIIDLMVGILDPDLMYQKIQEVSYGELEEAILAMAKEVHLTEEDLK